MGIEYTQPGTQATKYSEAMIYRNAGHQVFRDWALSGIADPDPSGLTAQWCPVNEPFALGTGFLVDSTGQYIMPPGSAVSSFFVVNADPLLDLYAGVNVSNSGLWASGDALVIKGSGSHEFGGLGTQPIQNVWAMAPIGATVWVQGYATNLFGS